ncbi:MAG TPA: Smr/MutS family protein [Rhizomicrobium sp.]|nr:Smr/MutS family protein [Rhizomicrobium sp.]
MVKRPLSEAERELFETAMRDSAPLKKARPRKKQAPGKSPVRAEKHEEGAREERAQPPQPRTRRTVGIDGNTAERLRRGQLEPQARLDLHGMSERDAHRALVTFVRVASARKLRLLLVVTGKGGSGGREQADDAAFDLGLDMRARGILRSLTPRWLHEPGLAEVIADVREAHRRHGGSGAVYVYLRKGETR